QENDGAASATPIKDFQLNVLFDAHESRSMGRWVPPLGGTLRVKAGYEESAQDKTDHPTVPSHSGLTPSSTEHTELRSPMFHEFGMSQGVAAAAGLPAYGRTLSELLHRDAVLVARSDGGAVSIEP